MQLFYYFWCPRIYLLNSDGLAQAYVFCQQADSDADESEKESEEDDEDVSIDEEEEDEEQEVPRPAKGGASGAHSQATAATAKRPRQKRLKDPAKEQKRRPKGPKTQPLTAAEADFLWSTFASGRAQITPADVKRVATGCGMEWADEQLSDMVEIFSGGDSGSGKAAIQRAAFRGLLVACGYKQEEEEGAADAGGGSAAAATAETRDGDDGDVIVL